VAGVDYYVGIPAGTVLNDWVSISDPNISISTGTVNCHGAGASVTLNAIDFSLHSGAYIYIPSGGCAKLTITSSYFGCNSYNSGPAYSFIINQNNATVTVKYVTIDPTNCLGLGTTIGGDVIQYVWLKHSTTPTSGQFVGTRGSGIQDVRFNLIDDQNVCSGCHENYLQWTTLQPNMGNVNFDFNTSMQLTPGGAEGPQASAENTGNFTNISFSYNTMIAAPNGQTMSYMMHGNGSTTSITGTALVSNNFFDPRGAYGAFYPGSFTNTSYGAWTASGNIEMNTGQTITP
jgi:hypothetical protein